MKQYLRLKPFKAISFDLDDTLYDNVSHIIKAEAEISHFMQDNFKAPLNWGISQWRLLKSQVIAEHQELAHDTTAARYEVLRQGLLLWGYSEAQASQGAQQGMQCFSFHRSDFKVTEEVLSCLANLGKHFPLVGITNGNVDATRIGLDDVLQFVLHPGHGVRMKPYSDLFDLSCRHLAIKPSELLHIGDHTISDVLGARKAGCQSVWLNHQASDNRQAKYILPHIEIHQLDDLTSLFG
ncbi:HAD-IA family hydrolase [Shewanella sp. 4_MG-2023]|uniref:HAD-IA family hydrolase n=1 Tax=Shewanella sp. 4_MG-2023 TaxID=3062652 RepID=UPI0026E16007|nr:HAD-IA family hydrolase [Shewanella sp. 4_MG-2023]MDO6679376.1 HAD-IA family hydrolase [Shewanella sp. 4_MG-2023]